MNAYPVKTRRLTGTDYHEVFRRAFGLFKQLKAKSKRRPYIRSPYFKGEKVFLELFWRHLDQKHWKDRVRRLRYFPCAIDLLAHSKLNPVSKENPNKPSELFHRFFGITPSSELFFVQIKEDKRSGQKWFMSVFPEDT